jgi:thiosulfate/3-mercaptopyruvate sulfurtransferase
MRTLIPLPLTGKRTHARRSFMQFLLIALVVAAAQPLAADGFKGNLADVAWLDRNLGRADVLILDASPAQIYAAQHIPGAVGVDIFSYGGGEAPVAAMQERLQSWGVSPEKTIIAYDQGGTFLATRLFFALAYYGFPLEKVAVLDGGLAKWQAAGLPVTSDVVVARKGSFEITSVNEDVRVRLPEFLTGSGDRTNYAIVEALSPDWHYGEVAPFDRPGHIPNSVLLPAADFFNPDKTFKSPDELRKMTAYMSVGPEQRIYPYCGGGIAASVPFFALRYILGYPNVQMFVESELGWLSDDRQLPYWTYDAPHLMRDTAWLKAWGGRMMRMYGLAKTSVIDIRTKEEFDDGHVPFAVNLPADVFRHHLANPEGLAAVLGAAGVEASHEAVVVSGAGLTNEAALAFAVLEKIGQKRVSLYVDALAEAAKSGFLTKEPTAVGPPKGAGDIAILPSTYAVELRTGVFVADPESTRGVYPKVFVASGATLPATVPEGSVVHVPSADLLNADGSPKAAKEIWAIVSKAGLPRYAELVTFADDPADAALNYFILKLMGWPDVKVLAGAAPLAP